jgi:CubicO group peptidase (beta-lactamase class C family)
VHSIRKALLNSLFGIVFDEGRINLNDTLKSLGVDKLVPELNSQELTATLEMVLKSRSGIYLPSAAESEGMKHRKPEREAHKPGS